MHLQFLVDSKGLWYISLYATVELNKLQCPSSTSELRRESAPNPLDADALWIKHEQELLCYHKMRKFPQAPDLHLISIVTAIAIHASATYGDRRSPIRAAMKNNPRKPCLFLSINRGATPRTYVQVQMTSRITRSSD